MSLKTASVLAFERKLDPSDALFYAGRWEQRRQASDWPAIAVREKSVRGTISNRLKIKASGKDIDPAKIDAEVEKPNLQRVDVATLPPDADTLKARFTLRVLGGAGVPSTCNDADYRKRLDEIVGGYVTSNGFGELARRYACNLANGRFLWRNRVGAEAVEIRIRQLQDGEPVAQWTFDALAFDLRRFEAPASHREALAELSAAIESGLSGRRFVLLEVEAYARMGDGQEVFPSQELVMDKGSDKAGQKSKTLYTVEDAAGMHSQKLGNALRCIDDWYPDEEDLGPIAVEPYGSVTSRGKAYRQPGKKLDFYSLLDQWALKDKAPEPDQQHYLMAVLIRGGVFGESGKE